MVATAVPRPTQTAIAVISPTNASPPPETPTPIVADIPESLPTETPNLTSTPLSTDTPQPIPTIVLTPPAGVIYFLWDPKAVEDIAGWNDPRVNLYKAEFLDFPGQWEIQPVVEGLVVATTPVLSPDQTKLAFSIVEDSNGDGHASVESNSRGFDLSRLHLYDLDQEILTKTPFSPPYNIYVKRWLPDGQTLAFIAGDLFFWNTASQRLPGELIYPEGTPRNYWLEVSPNGQWVAVRVENQVEIIHTQSKEIKQIISEAGSIFNFTDLWSPDSHWLMLTDHSQPPTGILFDLETDEMYEIPVPEEISNPRWLWSHDSQFLLLFDRDPDTPPNRIYQFTPATQQMEILLETSATIVADLAWTIDDERIVFLLFEEGPVTLAQFDVITSELNKLWENTSDLKSYPYYPYQKLLQAWSPDGEWALIMLVPTQNKHTLALLHLGSRQIYPLSENQMTLLPYSFFWVSEE